MLDLILNYHLDATFAYLIGSLAIIAFFCGGDD